MKKQALLPIASLSCIFAVVIIISQNQQNRHQRSDYESFITETAKTFMGNQEIEEGDLPGEDRPDEAAFTEFIKTLDPSLNRVPAEKRVEALQETDRLAGFKSVSSGLHWKSHTANMGGRTRVLMYDPNDLSGMGVYAGAVTGGLWYNPNPLEGYEWSPVNDYWPNLAVSCMAYDPRDTKTLYIGTGESQTALIIYRESSTRGVGIMKSEDGGKNWDLIPSTKDWAYVTDLLVRDEDGVSVIYAGVVSGIYKGAGHHSLPSDGLYRSMDGGDSWEQVLPVIPGSERPYAPSDISVSSDMGRIFVGTTYGINETGTDLNREGAACILHSDDGINWEVERSYNESILENEIAKYPGRVMIANSESDPDITYAIIASGYPAGPFLGYGCEFLLKSSDKGDSWEEINFPQGFASLAWHAFAIEINPDNPNEIWLGGLDVWRSQDGGLSWRHLTNWAEPINSGTGRYVHADIHTFLFHPQNSRHLYVATDGGVFFTGSSQSPDNVIFHEMNDNFNTLQYYSAALHPEEGIEIFEGGLQDNGTLLYSPTQVAERSTKLSGGDGAICFIDQDEPDIHISTSQNTTIYLSELDQASNFSLRAVIQGGVGLFINPMDYDWKNNKLYCNMANFIGEASNAIGCVTIEKWNFDPLILEINTDTDVAFSAVKWSDCNLEGNGSLFLGTVSGRLFKLQDCSDPESAMEITGDNFPAGYLGSIDAGKTQDTLLVTFSNYGVSSVWLSTDGGESWKDLDSNLPDMPVRWGIFHPESSSHVMLATETGTWTTSDALADVVHWSIDNNGMANVRVDMLRVRQSDNTVLAATHGRGMFTAKWETGGTSSAADLYSSKKLEVFPNPSDGKIFLQATLPSKAVLNIHDAAGRLVCQDNLEAGPLNRKYDLERLEKGLYYITVECLSERYTKKFILK